MAILQNSIIPAGATAPDEEGGDSVPTHSLRFDGGSTSHLYRSLGSTDTTWTLSFWMKRVYVTTPDSNNRYAFSINDSSGLYWAGSATQGQLGYYDGSGVTLGSALYRDPTAWMHCAVVCDSSTADVYINGYIAPNMSGISMTEDAVDEIRFGNYGTSSSHSVSQYLHDIYFVEGSAVTPIDNFIELDSTSGVYKPKVYSLSSAGSNSFHLDFEDSSDIGNDVSNDNDFTPTNLSSHDIVPDIPTNNFCTLSSIDHTGTLSEGNLEWVNTSGNYHSARSTFAMNSGKWYAEFYFISTYASAGICTADHSLSTYQGGTSDSWAYTGWNDRSYHNTSYISGPSGVGAGSVVMVAYDADNGSLYFGAEGTWYSSFTASYTGLDTSKDYYFAAGSISSGTYGQVANFGADPTFAGNKTASTTYADGNGKGSFLHEPPTGYLALCSANLSATIADPSANFQAVTYSGAWDEANMAGDETQDVTTNFKPELIWIKDRDNSSQNSYYGHNWFNSILGTSAGGINPVSYGRGTSLDSGYYGVTGFNATSFTVDKADETNYAEDADLSGDIGSGDTLERYIAYCWKLGTTASSWSGSGTDPTEEKYNATAGISLLRYSNSGSGGAITLNHSLGVAPDAALVMDASGSVAPYLWHKSLTNAASGGYLRWAANNASGTDTDIFPSSNSTSTTFVVGSTINAGSGTDLYIFLISEVAGFSAVGSFEASGTLPVIYTGFRPSFIWTKNIDANNFTPLIHDAAREPANPVDQSITVSNYSSEPYDTASDIDFLSNGFKMRESSSSWNNWGNTTGYIAFGEQAAKHSLAR